MKKTKKNKNAEENKQQIQDLTFYQLTDLHYYATDDIGSCGKLFDFKCATDQKCMAESGAIIDATFDKLIADKDTRIVVITGDNTFDGEVPSHKSLARKIDRLKAAGKKVYVTFATHDFNMEARGYNDDGVFMLPKYTREELRQFYAPYGWNEAIAEHTPSYSYAVKPAEGYRFLMLNDDGDGLAFCGYYDDLLEWIKAQAEEAKEAGERIFAFTHHPVTPPSKVYPLFSHRDMLGGYETTAPFLADCGIEFIFTGHTHMQSITKLETESGNKMYHINTGSAIAYPVPYRKVSVNDEGVDVKTEHIDSFNWPMHGKSVQEYTKDHFEFMLKDIFYSAENDIEEFKLLAKGFSLDAQTIERFKPIFKLLGKIINGLTFKALGTLMLCSSKIDKSIADKKVRDFLLDLVRNMYSGIKPYNPETPEYKAFMPIVGRVAPFINIKDSEGNKVNVKELVEDLLYNVDNYDNTNQFLPY